MSVNTDQKTIIYCFFYKCAYKQQLYIVIMLKILPKAWHWKALWTFKMKFQPSKIDRSGKLLTFYVDFWR